jgi:ELP3 family radical SAM enzyme/protein acetyltransferase
MPDLPGSSWEKDMNMFQVLLGIKSSDTISDTYTKYDLVRPDLQPDQLKVYPCTTVDFTLIKEWYEQGLYKPYSENEEKLIEVVKFIKVNMYPWIRLNRIIRDIPNINILGGNTNVNLRQKVLRQMVQEGKQCNCIRCREIKGKSNVDLSTAKLFIDEYNDVGATEYFLSYCSPCKKDLYGFLRLRIIDNNEYSVYKEFSEYAFIRELHVYGLLVKHDKEANDESVQHKGIGTKLLCEAEKICYQQGLKNIAIISGVGVIWFYRKKGYTLKNNYMIKNLTNDKIKHDKIKHDKIKHYKINPKLYKQTTYIDLYDIIIICIFMIIMGILCELERLDFI